MLADPVSPQNGVTHGRDDARLPHTSTRDISIAARDKSAGRGNIDDTGGWKQRVAVITRNGAAPPPPGSVIPAAYFVSDGSVLASNAGPPAAPQQPAPASANPDAAPAAVKPTAQPPQQAASPSAVRTNQAIEQMRAALLVTSSSAPTTLAGRGAAAAKEASLRKELNSALAAELAVKAGANADDAQIMRAGETILARYAGDPVAQYLVSGAVIQIRSERSNAVIPVADFIRYVGDVERGYAKDTPEQNLTRIRTQYYHGFAFEALIPDAPYAIDVGTVRRVSHGDAYDFPVTVSRRLEPNAIGPTAYRHLTAKSDGDVASGDNPSIIRPNGEEIDVGHLLVGLDALLHPRTLGLYSDYDVKNIDPSSWIGDLGAASVWMTRHEREGKPSGVVNHPPKTPDLDVYYRMSAPQEDLLADVDSFGAKAQWDATPGQSLSQVLRSYYEGTGPTSVQQRFQIFCSANELTYTRNGNTINWDPALVERLTARVDKFNDLYAAGRLGVAWHAAWGTEPSHEKWPHTPKIVEKFLDWVKTQLEAELANPSGPTS